MRLDKVIKTRRSTRKYKTKIPTNKQIEKIINAGIYAPSAHNRQPWKIKIATTEEKQKIASELLKEKDKDKSVIRTSNIIKEVPVLLIIFHDKQDENKQHDLLSLGAFIENMHLKATDMHLGSLWIANTDYIKDKIKKITKTNLECISCLAIGYKNETPREIKRKTKEDIIIS